MAYMEPGTAVVEFPLKPHSDRTFGFMAAALDIDYWVVPNLSSHYFGHYNVDRGNTASVISLIKDVLEHAGLSKMLSDDEL